nr:WG repeat-containing protein [Nannocystis sp.]
MSGRAAKLSPVLWAMLAACSPPAAPATKPAPAASDTPVVAQPTGTSPTVAIPTASSPTPPRPATAGWKSFDEGGLVGFKDAQGKVALSPRFATVQEFSPGGMACGADKDGWVCIDGNGTPLLRPFVFDNGPDQFSEGLARFVEAGKLGFFDETGFKKIPARFSFARPFAGNRAAFCDGCTRRCEAEGEHCDMVGGKWGLIDKTGAEIVAPTFDELDDFEDGKARARRDGEQIVIDPDGRVTSRFIQKGG